MADETLLDIVQEILSDADGDNVSDIAETTEADQCARIVRQMYNEVVDNHDITYRDRLVKLNATSSTTPNVMTRPEGLFEIEWIKYNTKLTSGGNQDYTTIGYMDPEEFLDMVSGRPADGSNVEEVSVTASGHSIPVLNDRAPSYWTILEGYENIVFDAYDSNLDANLQESKSLCKGTLKPTLTLSNTSVLDLPENYNSIVKNMARAYFFDIFKNGVTPMIGQRLRRSEVRSQRQRHITKLESSRTGPDYGRK